ncbi:hypothetical protein BIT28_13710 [Photobacterium proteolyticum]|uniref:Carrier domain-containing protein n=1 Tax=Photobacterium proteolyticum TaxID=1903952 RepID=A0A1Q9GJ38_9GAMM|nr:amino acid adenylation domain-containing protein [Photobacterium proteolyticum]OLQ74471.1 hypothetical protein BIT28_13710 [Photobacterium proteolyticum]
MIKTVVDLFEQQARIDPQQEAVYFQGQSLSYKQLDEYSNQVAHFLLEAGKIAKEECVGIYMDRSPEMVIAMLAIQKAGGAYVPIAVELPGKRIDYMIRSANIRLVFANSRRLDFITSRQDSCQTLAACLELNITSIDYDSPFASTLQNPLSEAWTRWHNFTTAPLPVKPEHTQLAYVIFTSGTTGNPKGVMIEHHALLNYCLWFTDFYKVAASDKFTQYAGFSFDASVGEIFPCLIQGATLHIIPDHLRLDVTNLNHYFHRHAISVSFLPTQFCEKFMQEENNSLRVVLTGGDKLNFFKPRNYRLYNNYGPTENTVVATAHLVTKGAKNIPIGQPVYNNQIYLFHENSTKPVDKGEAGEICIGGKSLARGYLNAPDLTATKFIQNPYIPGEKLYRTGDLACWLPDGNLAFLGRIDHQVKIRGYRIELGEIETIFKGVEAIDEAIVLAQADHSGEKHLCGYYVSRDTPTKQQIIDQLKSKLPDYMIPQFFIKIESVPLTANGKVDRKALANPFTGDNEKSGSTLTRDTHSSALQVLSNAIKKVMNRKDVSALDQFLLLGGTSLKAIEVINELRGQGFDLDIYELLKETTLAELSTKLADYSQRADQGIVTGEFPLIHSQLQFVTKNDYDLHHWFGAVMLFNEQGFEELLVEKAFLKLVSHHDVLRSRFVLDENQQISKQVILAPTEGAHVDFFRYHIEENSIPVEEQIQAIMPILVQDTNLETDPLLKVALFNTPTGDHLWIAAHQLIVDGYSTLILLQDFAREYTRLTNKGIDEYLLKSHSFLDFAEDVYGLVPRGADKQTATQPFDHTSADQENLLNQIGYWEEINNAETTTLPYDFQITKNLQGDSRTESIYFSPEETIQLSELATKENLPGLEAILLLMLNLSLRSWAGDKMTDKPIRIAKTALGRPNSHRRDFNRTVGAFAVDYPFLLPCVESPQETAHSFTGNFSALFQQMKKELKAVPNPEMGYLIMEQLIYPDSPEQLQPQGERDILWNYFGEMTTFENEIAFSLSPIPITRTISPNIIRDYRLLFNVMIYQGMLMIHLDYNSKEFKPESISCLLDEFQAWFREALSK